MACPGGCICGAGHPVPEKIDALEKRQQVLVNIDKTSKYRKSQENPDILRLYKDYYGEANSELAHKLLHTHYTAKSGDNEASNIRKKSDSAFITQEFTICICDNCSAKGSKELYSKMTETIQQLKMDSFINIKTIRLKETHKDDQIFLTLNGKQIAEPKQDSLYKNINRF